MEIKEIINKEGNILENFKQVAKIKHYIPLIEKIKLSQRLCEDYMTLQAVIEEKQYFEDVLTWKATQEINLCLGIMEAYCENILFGEVSENEFEELMQGGVCDFIREASGRDYALTEQIIRRDINHALNQTNQEILLTILKEALTKCDDSGLVETNKKMQELFKTPEFQEMIRVASELTAPTELQKPNKEE